MSKLSNALTMLEYLSSGRKYSIKELAEKLEVSQRMIREYKNEIELAGIYIDSIRGIYGGYVLNQKINIPKRFIGSNKLIIENKEYFNLINKAIKEKSKCYLEYYSKTNQVSKRKIVPYELIVLNDRWGVAAFCNLKNEIRHFYLDRIKSIKII